MVFQISFDPLVHAIDLFWHSNELQDVISSYSRIIYASCHNILQHTILYHDIIIDLNAVY